MNLAENVWGTLISGSHIEQNANKKRQLNSNFQIHRVANYRRKDIKLL